MSKNQPNSTQKTALTRVKSTQDKIARKIKSMLKTATPEETLEVWRLIKRQELKRTTPNLSDEQIESVVHSLILELGYDIITISTSPIPTSALQKPGKQTDESVLENSESDNDTDADNYNLEDDEDNYSEEFNEQPEEKTSRRKQRVPALRKIDNLRASTRNGRHS
ncbi:MAG: hypothetical protein RIM23_22435 [Coleofasciculus sp. G3-WIS-01]|uniref:hypothetical protein n=1 Tax=Coleofasciculus sp. G3-WIS-01 TaxID=3069528 RepID=UPI003304FE53